MPMRPAASLLLTLLLLPATLWAHGDADKPLFVASDGSDSSRCKDPQQPCQSLSYALKMVGKGGQIYMTEGSFDVTSSEDLFMLISGSVEVRGGYLNDGEFRSSSDRATILTGIPPEYREVLAGKGFHVIADTKGQDAKRSAEARELLALNAVVQSSMAATPCTGGSVNGLPCDSIDLLSHMAFSDISGLPGTAADVWGFVDLNSNREYAIVGYRNGTAVIDVTDPENPREISYIFGQSTSWRDVKIYQHYDDAERRWKAYAYVTSDNASEGMFVIDLSGLPHYVQRAAYISDFSAAHNVYASGTDYATGIALTGAEPRLIIAGSSVGGGRFRMYSLTDPASPQFIGDAGGAGYMHDASSMIITDARKDTQCINATSSCEVLFDFNENEIDIWDISAAGDPRLLGFTAYNNASYVHSGWWTEDKQYLFGQDELDEQRAGLPTTLRVFSLADLRTPTLVGSWPGPTVAIDHNGFVRGNRYYMSNYSRGLTILDISNPVVPIAVGSLDTYPFSNSSSFVGAWGAFPYFHSGTVAISDISSGFYLADDQTRGVVQGSFEIGGNSYSVTEGSQVSVDVHRTGGSTGSVTVAYELVGATADAGDFSATPDTLTWSAGDIAPKNIVVSATNDGAAESMEHVLLRLIAPTGGATLANRNTTSVYLNDPGATPVIEFLSQNIDVSERGSSRAIVVLNRSGSADGAISINVDMTGGDATPVNDFTGSTSTVVSWTDGDASPKSLEFNMIDDGANETTEFFTLSLSNANGSAIGSRNSVTINIGNGSGINQAPNANAGSSQTAVEDNTVSLDGSASSDPNGDPLAYAWTQTLGPSVTLTNADTAVASFTAPSVASDMMLQFRLTVSDPFGRSDTAIATVTVRSSSGGQSNSSGGGSAVALAALLVGLLLLRAYALRRRGAASRLSAHGRGRSR